MLIYSEHSVLQEKQLVTVAVAHYKDEHRKPGLEWEHSRQQDILLLNKVSVIKVTACQSEQSILCSRLSWSKVSNESFF